MDNVLFLAKTRNFLEFISSYFNHRDEKGTNIDSNELPFFIKLSKHHSLTALLYQALMTAKVNVDEEILRKLEEYYLHNLRKCVLFDKERNELFSYLNENKIDYLPLKGIILKDYYLDPYTREFADNDILFFNKDSASIKAFFVDRDYDVKLYKRGNDDVYIKKPFYNFEMHRSLFAYRVDNKNIVRYFENYLSKSNKIDNYEHYLSKEDFYIYFLAHSYKHYHVSGCGIRTLIDIYLYLKKEQLDFNYVNEELKKLDLLDFSNKIINLSNKVFNNEALSEEEEQMLLFIASSGTYGTLEHSVDKGVEEHGKFGYFMYRLFPPFISYKTTHPWAYKCPFLIPFAWFDRFFRYSFKNPKHASSELKMISKQKNREKNK